MDEDGLVGQYLLAVRTGPPLDGAADAREDVLGAAADSAHLAGGSHHMADGDVVTRNVFPTLATNATLGKVQR